MSKTMPIFFNIILLTVEIINAQINLAPFGVALQSSTYSENQFMFNASFAITGPATHIWKDGCSHTLQESGVWWKIEFDSGYMFFTNVIIHYREYFSYRMDGFSLYVTNSSYVNNPPDGYLCYEDDEPGYPNILQDIDCYAVGKNVLFYNNRSTFVELCYVETFGCAFTKWGPKCMSSCPTYCINQHCFPENGSCVVGCKSDFCLDNFCENDGSCVSGCIPGRTGRNCAKLCPSGTYGSQCLRICSPNCFSTSCNPVTGECDSGGCIKGWQGINCTTVCDNGHYGFNCFQSCDGCIAEQCDPVDGTCLTVNKCKPGWKYGPKCNTPCDDWTFGGNCVNLCNCLSLPCDKSTGKCPEEKCKKGWKGDACNEECSIGFYGLSCNQSCDGCIEDACERFEGICAVNFKCKPGWKYEPKCSMPCEEMYFGNNCTMICSCGNEPCDKATGKCGYSQYHQEEHNNKAGVIGGGLGAAIMVSIFAGVAVILIRRRYNKTKQNEKQNNAMDTNKKYIYTDLQTEKDKHQNQVDGYMNFGKTEHHYDVIFSLPTENRIKKDVAHFPTVENEKKMNDYEMENKF